MLGDVKGVLGEDSYMGAHQSNSVQSTLFLLVTDEESKAYGTIWPNKKRENKENSFSPSWKNSVTRVVFVGGIGLHLMTYYIDQSVSLGNRCVWFNVQKEQAPNSITSAGR